jgi:hypothetical protein
MPRPSTVALAIFGAALVTWLAAASSTGLRTNPPRVPDVREQSATAGALLGDVSRLHERLEQTPGLVRPTRNPFRFAAPRHGVAAPGAKSRHGEVASGAQPADAGLSLVGMAEEPGVDGAAPQRTAIVASAGEVFLVKAGDPVAGRYRVSRIDADAIELARIADASVVRLSLK